MGRFLCSVTMSLDGFIAGPGGDMSWLAPYLGDGTRLFSSPGGRDVRLERTHVTEMAHATGLWFRVVR